MPVAGEQIEERSTDYTDYTEKKKIHPLSIEDSGFFD